MKKLSLIICIVLSLMTIFLLFSCGGDTSTGNNDTNTDNVKNFTFVFKDEVYQNGTAEENANIEAPAINPKKTGYDFIGWTNNGKIVSFPYQLDTDTVFEAKFAPIEYEIKYNLNGGTNDAKNPKVYTIDDVVNLQAPVIDSEYYDFAGWYTDESFFNQITKIEGSTGNITLYAKWVMNSKALTFTKVKNGYSITACASDIVNVIIPNTYNGLPVLAIANSAFKNCNALTSVIIPDSVISLGDYAFDNCPALTSVVIPDSITFIHGTIFKNCNSLTIYCEAASKPRGWDIYWNRLNPSVVWGYNNIQDNATYDYFLKNNEAHITKYKGESASVVIPETIDGYKVVCFGSTFNSNSAITSITIPNNITVISDYAFYGCTSLTSVIIPNNAKTIGSHTFYNCTLLKDIIIPDSVTVIEDYAFYGCASLSNIILPNNVTEIKFNAFYGCDLLTKVVIPVNVVQIGSGAFHDCSSLTIYCEAVSKPNGWDYAWNNSNYPVVWGYNNIQDNATYDYVLKNNEAYITKYKGESASVVIPETIDGYKVVCFGSTFNSNSVITSITIPDSITLISDYAFSSCTSLTSVNMGNSITQIGNFAFAKCTALTSIRINGNLTCIGESAFVKCSTLTSIIIPNSVAEIGATAFFGCTSLTIYCEATEQPNGWNTDWNSSSCPVEWGYTEE